MIPVRILLLIMAVSSLAEAQRSFYASRPRSKLLPRYQQNETESTTVNLVNRGGDEDSLNGNNAGGIDTSDRNTDFDGTLEEDKFLNRVAQWPEDRQPFWFKNRKVISAHRGQEAIGGNSGDQSFGTRVNPQFQSPFAGNRVTFSREPTSQRRANRRADEEEESNLPSRIKFNRNRQRFLSRDN